jgi:8-oxo-dGTP diphosphatase
VRKSYYKLIYTYKTDSSTIKKVKLGVLCFIREKNKTLMLHRNKKKNDFHEGKWLGIGGHMEDEESPKEAVVREIEE